QAAAEPQAAVQEAPVQAEPVQAEQPVVQETVQTETQAAPVAETQSATTETTATSTNAAKEWIAQKESSGSYTATNGRYIGRYQLDSSYLNGDYSAANQEKVAEQYVASRYGSWEAAKAFWEANGWY
ncbi:TPA: peptidase M23, partial [Enterococcus faecium]|nr:peptidase M23 [Enterococcus faecium]MDW7896082.1 peptidase M23 [Enterococcus faecium]HAQ6876593.1 peptidase M23 [Enterococcus faecium]